MSEDALSPALLSFHRLPITMVEFVLSFITCCAESLKARAHPHSSSSRWEEWKGWKGSKGMDYQPCGFLLLLLKVGRSLDQPASPSPLLRCHLLHLLPGWATDHPLLHVHRAILPLHTVHLGECLHCLLSSTPHLESRGAGVDDPARVVRVEVHMVPLHRIQANLTKLHRFMARQLVQAHHIS